MRPGQALGPVARPRLVPRASPREVAGVVVAESCDRARVTGVGRANFMQLSELWASVTCGLGVVPLTPMLAPESRGVGARGAR